jgi:hypothetical protein
MKAACAWCVAEANGTAAADTSHGICQRHYEALVMQSGTLPAIARRLLTAYAKCNPVSFALALEEMRQAVAAETEVSMECNTCVCGDNTEQDEECVWAERKDKLGYQNWNLACGFVMEDEINPIYNRFKFCPMCGRRIRLVCLTRAQLWQLGGNDDAER